MSFLSSVKGAITAPINIVDNLISSSDSGQKTYTTTKTNVNPITNVTTNLDTKPIVELLSKNSEIDKIKIVNSNLDRELELTKIKKIDKYIEQFKNISIGVFIIGSLIYFAKK